MRNKLLKRAAEKWTFFFDFKTVFVTGKTDDFFTEDHK